MTTNTPTDPAGVYSADSNSLFVRKDLLEAAIAAAKGGQSLTAEQWAACARLSATALEAAGKEILRLREALKIIAEGAICPELFPGETDEDRLQLKTAVVTAIAALEPRDE